MLWVTEIRILNHPEHSLSRLGYYADTAVRILTRNLSRASRRTQGGSNMTGTDLCVNKPHCAAAVRPWESEATPPPSLLLGVEPLQSCLGVARVMSEQKVPRSMEQCTVIKFLVGENVQSAEIHHRLQQQYGEECLRRRHSSPYRCWSLCWISADGTFSPARNLITMRCSTLRGTFCSLITLATPRQDWTGSNPSRREGGGVASLSQGRTAAAQCGLFTYKSVPVIFEPPCIFRIAYKYNKFQRDGSD